MNNARLYLFLFCILVALNCYVLYKMHGDNPKQILTSLPDPPAGEAALRNNIISAYKNTGLPLNDPLVYLGSDTNNTFGFFSKITKPTLIVRFSGEYCENCIEFVILKLQDEFPDFKTNDRIILLGSELNPRVKDGYYGKKLLSYKSTTLGLPIEKHKAPSLFITDKNKVSQLVFLPLLSEPALTVNYLKSIKHKYFN